MNISDSDLDRLRGLRILVVEDTFMLADELDDLLLELGCRPRISKPLDLGTLVRVMLRHFAPVARLHG